jgi:TRAP-type mannitol/chloroaromatic compound transport system permease small subunit
LSVDPSKINEVLPHTDQFPHTAFSAAVRLFFQSVARGLSWIWIALMVVIVVNVTMRYAFGEGRIEFEEIQWHLYAVGFLIGLATCMDSDNHVRVDVFHDRITLRSRAWIELYGLLLLFFPFVLSVLIFAFPFVEYSFSSAEISEAASGLPFRWAIKSVLPLSMGLLIVAGISRLSRVSALLFSWPSSNSRARDVDVD